MPLSISSSSPLDRVSPRPLPPSVRRSLRRIVWRCLLCALACGFYAPVYYHHHRELSLSYGSLLDGVSWQPQPDISLSPLTSSNSLIDEFILSPTSLRHSLQMYIHQESQRNFAWQFSSLHRTAAPSTFYDAVASSSSLSFVPSSVLFWNTIQYFEMTTTTMNQSSLLHTACTDPPGSGWEGGRGAHRLLTQKIQLYTPPSTANATFTDERTIFLPTASTIDHFPRSRPLRLLCAIYTHPPMHSLVRMAALTWGVECDGFVAFSTETQPSLGRVALPHRVGPDSYHNMWQKTRAIWKYIYTHYYYQDYDYIHLSGDDVYILVPNLKHFLHQHEQRFPSAPVFAGQWIRQRRRPYVGGGPGYTLSRSALHFYMQRQWATCYPNVTASAEDRYLSRCMEQAGVPLTDTRDLRTGEQTYHDCPPQQVYDGRSHPQKKRKPNFHSRALAYWETLPYPVIQDATMSNHTEPPWRPITNASSLGNRVGPKYGIQAAAKYSIAFHKIHHPLFMLRIHALLHPHLCSF